jgi:hypothetical protein
LLADVFCAWRQAVQVVRYQQHQRLRQCLLQWKAVHDLKMELFTKARALHAQADQH